MASLNHGMSRLVFIVYRNAIAAFALAPFALIFERKIRPKMTLSVFIQILALGFLEPVVDQGFTFLGMQYTSASFASAVMNAVPSVTFVLAVILRLERVRIKELRSQAKVIGTLATFIGALLMTLYKGPQIHLFHDPSSTHHQDGGHSAQNHHPHAWAIGFDYRLYGPLYTGIMSSGIAYYIQALVMKSRGPVFVTSFNPLCMIIVAALGSFLLGEHLYLGSIIGSIIIAVGLYSVVWGKGKDYTDLSESSETIKGAEKQQLPITSSPTTEK
ncbi:EamA domain [Sesbania bispinosa]|nr:EamA domain [Sesbania bispinosa]